MAEARHGRLTTSEGIHIVYQWSYASSAARTGATGFEAHHVGKLAYQEDTDELWMLTATTPTWSKVGGPDSAITLSDHDHTGDAGDGGQIGTGALSSKTGSDTSVVTGTAGGDGDAVIWNADGDAVEGAPLGTSPEGDFDDVAARLDAGENTYANDIDADAGAVVMVPEFTYDGVTYEGMLVQKYPACQPNATPWDDNPDVADGAAIGGTKPSARAGVSPWREVTYLAAREACGELGVGWFLTPAHMWAHLAYRSLYYNTQPHGASANTNPPSDAGNSTTGTLDKALYARSSSYKSALTGTGHVSWSHNWRSDGVYGLSGVIGQWVSGLFLLPASLSDDSTTPHVITGAGGAGYCLIHANRDLSMQGAPFGSSTATAAGSLTDSNKAWTVDEFAGCYLYDKAGALYYVDSNTATALSVDGADTPTAGVYEVLKLVSTDITSGMTSGNLILTLQSSADLKPLAIPATSDGTGSATYGNDGYWHAATALRAARRGGSWASGTKAGIFALGLRITPSNLDESIGFRACKAL